MGTYTVLMPDVGEGVAEAELVEWSVKVGDKVTEDDVLGIILTDKAAVEVPSSVNGTVLWLGGEVGDTLAIGAPFIKLEVEGEGNWKDLSASSATAATPTEFSAVDAPTPIEDLNQVVADVTGQPVEKQTEHTSVNERHNVQASPAVRKRAADNGIDLIQVHGTGPAGRVQHEDLDAHLTGERSVRFRDKRAKNVGIEEIKVNGMRRKIAEKMVLSSSRIPHITVVEEVDVSQLEELRSKLNQQYAQARTKLTVLPFVMQAIVEAIRDQPQMNARYDDEAEVIHQHGGVHIGIATQTQTGLAVPVAKHVETLNPWQAAAEVLRLSQAAREGKATRAELSGSTITISSLGPLGALVTTPIINYPEVAIVGINKMSVRPLWDGQQFAPRKVMNISCSFDHRVIDGWDAAVFVQKLKTLLEHPGLLFIEPSI